MVDCSPNYFRVMRCVRSKFTRESHYFVSGSHSLGNSCLVHGQPAAVHTRASENGWPLLLVSAQSCGEVGLCAEACPRGARRRNWLAIEHVTHLNDLARHAENFSRGL